MEISREMDFAKLLEEEKHIPGPIIPFMPIAEIVNGLHRRLVILGGFSGSYKTTFALNIAYYNAIYLGYTTAFLSLEVDSRELWKKLLIRHAQHEDFSKYKMDINLSNGHFASLSQDQKEFLELIVGPDLSENKEYGHIIILTAEDLFKYKTNYILYAAVQRLDELGINFGIDLFIIDYLQLLAGSIRPSGIDKYQFSGDVVRYLKNLTQVYKSLAGDGLNVIALSQMNRDGFKNAKDSKGKYDLTSLAESSELANAADIVITLYADAEDKKSKRCKVQLLKNRFGETIEEPIEMLALPESTYMGDFRQSTNVELEELVNSLLYGISSRPRDFHLDIKA